MNRSLFQYISSFILFLLLQVLVLNEIQLHGLINPIIYPLFILLLPMRTPKALVMFIAFLLGLGIDIFSNTIGLHASASVFLAFVRPGLLNRLQPQQGYDPEHRPSLKVMGFEWFFIYVLVGLLSHHIFYFSVEMFGFEDPLSLLLKIFLSTLLGILLIFLHQFIFDGRK